MLTSIKKYNTFIDRSNPITKMALALVLFITVVFIHNPNYLFHLSIIMLLAMMLLSGVKFRYLAGLLCLILVLGFISSLYMIFYGEGTTTVYKFGIIHITEESFVRGIHIMMRGLVLSFFGAVIIFTTRITDVFYSLMQQLKIKPKYAYSFMAAVRMVPIIASEYMALRQARKVRKALIHKKYVSGIQGFKTTIITLLSQSIRRAYRLGIAMESKGFDDGPRTYYHKTSFSISDVFLILFTVASVYTAFQLGEMITPFASTDAR
ncbi:energy-coupling factor transporter transmembrane component T family protein [Salinicoccus sp. HZC-1]|uniref:energy-coupling factor transporter transmembrane component T family protein n=1 Tax=Salinicoccus sp. HZC-1 TaxID=3385497 RepID=UPI00398BA558